MTGADKQFDDTLRGIAERIAILPFEMRAREIRDFFISGPPAYVRAQKAKLKRYVAESVKRRSRSWSGRFTAEQMREQYRPSFF